MKSFAICLLLLFVCSFASAQNGPTQPSVSLTWQQSTSSGITGNCVYRGTAAGTYTMPALFCSKTATTSFTDGTVVRGNTYHYAVTAQQGAAESPYSNDTTAVIATGILPPTLNPPTDTKLNLPKAGVPQGLIAVVR